MVFSKNCESRSNLRAAYLIPFNNKTIKSIKGIENQARYLSHDKGSTDSKF